MGSQVQGPGVASEQALGTHSPTGREAPGGGRGSRAGRTRCPCGDRPTDELRWRPTVGRAVEAQRCDQRELETEVNEGTAPVHIPPKDTRPAGNGIQRKVGNSSPQVLPGLGRVLGPVRAASQPPPPPPNAAGREEDEAPGRAGPWVRTAQVALRRTAGAATPARGGEGPACERSALPVRGHHHALQTWHSRMQTS